MRPHQIRDAIAENLPVLLPIGVLEYHGEHMAVGMDMLAVTRIFERLAGRQAIFRYLEGTQGEGWWGRRDMQEYYAQQTPALTRSTGYKFTR